MFGKTKKDIVNPIKDFSKSNNNDANPVENSSEIISKERAVQLKYTTGRCTSISDFAKLNIKN